MKTVYIILLYLSLQRDSHPIRNKPRFVLKNNITNPFRISFEFINDELSPADRVFDNLMDAPYGLTNIESIETILWLSLLIKFRKHFLKQPLESKQLLNYHQDEPLQQHSSKGVVSCWMFWISVLFNFLRNTPPAT